LPAPVLTYLLASPPLTSWGYHDWLRAASAALAAASTKLMASKLPGKNDLEPRVDVTRW
jgi:hypothetical protein